MFTKKKSADVGSKPFATVFVGTRCLPFLVVKACVRAVTVTARPKNTPPYKNLKPGISGFLFSERVDDGINVAVEDVLNVVPRFFDAVIGDAVLQDVVCSDFF